MTREEAIDFLECRRAYYTSLSTDTNPNVKATKVCGYTLAESANACLMAIEALRQKPKIGHWIDDCGGVKCSCCGYSIDDCFYAKTYCTDCGCRMESEVAECH